MQWLRSLARRHRLLAGTLAAFLFPGMMVSRCLAATSRVSDVPPIAITSNASNADAPEPAAESEHRSALPGSRAGVVYFIGSVNRPGGVALDSAQSPTLLQALALAGGPGRHAALTKVVLIREREGGRTVTTLNLKRILRGEDPDPLIRDRDIVYVPSRW